ncbi:MAG: glycosyltransferase [Candidatus Bathyarchaeota archaeon]|nr:glycosyltransferase [Candidatus Bathyarchaeota archaeon]
MPEPAIHFSVVFAVSAPRLGVKRALLLSAIALLPDLDLLLRIHRSMSHSIIVSGLAWLPILLSLYIFKRRYFALGFLCFLAFLSHHIVDCFQTYTPILYPIVDRSVWVEVDGALHISYDNLNPKISLDIASKPTIFKEFVEMDAPIFTSEGLPVSIILLAIPLILSSKRLGIPSGRIPDPPDRSSVRVEPTISKDDVTVVLPTLNEVEAIGSVISELRSEGYRNILVVDGYSSDGTVDVALGMGVKVVYQHGRGKAGAVKTGIEYASTPYTVFMDADHTYDPRDISKLLLHAANYDEVIGVRVDRRNIPLMNRFGNWVITKIFNILTGSNLSDVCSGLYVLKTERARDLDIESGGFSVEAEIAVQIASHGSITEVPVSYRRRIGKPKLRSFKHGFEIASTIIRLARYYNPPLLLASLMASALIPGAAIYLWVLYRLLAYGVWHSGWAILAGVLVIFGGQGLILSMVTLMMRRMERRITRMIERVGR